MNGSRTMAGGCFLTLFIILGFVAGLATRNALGGAMLGTALGAFVALAIWLVDRRRRP